MSHYQARVQKKAMEGTPVTVYTDPSGAWFVGAPGDMSCHPIPMGGFISEAAARRWADLHFPGGTWSAVGRIQRRTERLIPRSSHS